MSLKTSTLSLDDKIRILDLVVRNMRTGARAGNVVAKENYDALRAILADLQARSRLSRQDALVEIEAALDRVQRSQTAIGYDQGQLIALANTVIRRWPTLAQALERFEKEEQTA
jgi:hypothetical protein